MVGVEIKISYLKIVSAAVLQVQLQTGDFVVAVVVAAAAAVAVEVG